MDAYETQISLLAYDLLIKDGFKPVFIKWLRDEKHYPWRRACFQAAAIILGSEAV